MACTSREPKRFFARALILAAILTPLPITVAAQDEGDAEQEAQDSLETLVITASRLPLPARQAGASVTVLDEEYLNRRQALTVEELLRASPGVAVSRSGVLGSLAQVRMRGSEANHALILMDGIEVGDPALGGELDFSHVLAADVRRIEIVRGPMSALWGSDAVAGTINLISAPSGYGQELTSYLEGGRFATRRAGLSAARSRDAWGVQLSLNLLGTDGQNVSRLGDETDGYRNNTVHIAAQFRPSQELLLRFIARRTDSESQYDATSFLTGLPADSDNATERTHNLAAIQGRLTLRGGRWLQEASIAHSGSENHNFADGSATSETGGDKIKVVYQTSLFFDRADPAAAIPSLTLGLGHEREDYEQRAAASPFGDPNRDLSMESTDALAEFRMDASGRWNASAALRYDRNRYFQNAFSWRVSGLRNLRKGINLHAAYGIGVKNPTFIERFGYFSNFIGNPDLLPEESRGWELGASLASANSALTASVSWFSERLRDEINGFVFVPSAGGFTAANRSGLSQRRGVELEARWNTEAGLALTGAYTYLDASEPDAAGGEIHELRRPRHSGNLNLHYQLADKGIGLNLNLDFSGRRADTFFPPWPNPARRVWLESFVHATLTASWQASPRLRWHVRADNLGQARYEEVYGFRGPARSIHLGVRLSLFETESQD